MPKDMIREADAVIFWNDTPTGAPGWDILVTTLEAGDRDRKGMGYDNATGAIDAEWCKHPEARAKAVFADYFQSEDVTSLNLDMWAEVRHNWLTEFAKIWECGWARDELAADAQEPGGNPAGGLSIALFDSLVAEAVIFRRKVLQAIEVLSDDEANDVSMLAFSRQEAGAGKALDILLTVLGEDTDRRILNAAPPFVADKAPCGAF